MSHHASGPNFGFPRGDSTLQSLPRSLITYSSRHCRAAQMLSASPDKWAIHPPQRLNDNTTDPGPA